jgi:predicted ATPase
VAEPVLASIEIAGFLSIRSATVQLGALNVLIGANGSGKSNLVRVFEMVGRIADREPRFFVSLNGRASTLVHDAAKQIRLNAWTSIGQYEASPECGR